eukprot:8325069-Alexandrium_andersonii.AAC.1
MQTQGQVCERLKQTWSLSGGSSGFVLAVSLVAVLPRRVGRWRRVLLLLLQSTVELGLLLCLGSFCFDGARFSRLMGRSCLVRWAISPAVFEQAHGPHAQWIVAVEASRGLYEPFCELSCWLGQ